METEISPLLDEYWFDNLETAKVGEGTTAPGSGPMTAASANRGGKPGSHREDPRQERLAPDAVCLPAVPRNPSNRRYAVEENPDDIPNLVAEILTRAVERRFRRNLSSDFHRRRADLTRVRRRIDPLRTERRHLLLQGKIACSFDELTTDTARNRSSRPPSTGWPGSSGTSTSPGVAAVPQPLSIGPASATTYSLSRGKGGGPTPVMARRENAEDRQMLAAAWLAFNLYLPTEDPGRSRLPASERDQVWARRLFEAAVVGFYDTLLSPRGWTIKPGKKIDWQIERPTPGMEAILPSMKTDIVLDGPAPRDSEIRSRTIIDTKFTHILSTGQFGDTTLRSGYIYQIYAYLRSQEHEGDPLSMNTSGMLLHPSVDGDVDEAATIQGHRIRFATVDLAAES